MHLHLSAVRHDTTLQLVCLIHLNSMRAMGRFVPLCFLTGLGMVATPADGEWASPQHRLMTPRATSLAGKATRTRVDGSLGVRQPFCPLVTDRPQGLT